MTTEGKQPMRYLIQRPLAFAVIGLAAVLSGRALAQADPAPEPAATSSTEKPEEITVRGRRTLTEYRLELEEAREEIVKIFNEENSDQGNDLVCRNERPTGSRMPQRVCRTAAESAAEASAARWFLNSLTTSAGKFQAAPGTTSPGGPQINAAIGTAVAQDNEAAGGAAARAKLEEELLRLERENRKLYRAVVKYLELEDQYNKAREASGQ